MKINSFSRAAFAVLVLCIASSAALMAQYPITQCPCPKFTVNVEPAVSCDITLCYTTTPGEGPMICQTLSPGGTAVVPCVVGRELYVLECNGNPFALNPNGCTSVAVGKDCCIEVCFDVGACEVTITKAPCPQPGC